MKPVPVLLAAALLVAGCTAEDGPPAPHGAHESTPHQHTSLPAGDGTLASYVGYSLERLRLPTTAGTPGRYSFRIGTYTGVTETNFFADQTKRMHVYVVRDDLAVYRHVHPTMSDDGTWSGNLTLPSRGRYRLVAEFVAVDEGGNGDQVILGDWATVGGPTKVEVVPAVAARASDQGLTVHVDGDLRSGPTDPDTTSLTIGVTKDGDPAELGTYLGTYARRHGVRRQLGRGRAQPSARCT